MTNARVRARLFEGGPREEGGGSKAPVCEGTLAALEKLLEEVGGVERGIT